MVGRGITGGVKPTGEYKDGDEKEKRVEKAYDFSSVEDLEAAWDQCVQDLVYGDLMDQMFDHLASTPDFEGYSQQVAASTKYSVIQ